MPTRCARARIEAEGVHGDGAKSRTRHEKQIRCLAEWIPLGKRRRDSGPRRALIARRPRELHEADPGHDPRRRGKQEGRRASGCRARRRRQGRRSWPELGRDPGQSTKLGRGGRRRGGAVAGVLSRGWASLGRLVLRQEYSSAAGVLRQEYSPAGVLRQEYSVIFVISVISVISVIFVRVAFFLISRTT